MRLKACVRLNLFMSKTSQAKLVANAAQLWRDFTNAQQVFFVSACEEATSEDIKLVN